MQSSQHQCEADPAHDGPHDGPIGQIDGFWLCERHEMLYNTDGIWLRAARANLTRGTTRGTTAHNCRLVCYSWLSR